MPTKTCRKGDGDLAARRMAGGSGQKSARRANQFLLPFMHPRQLLRRKFHGMASIDDFATQLEKADAETTSASLGGAERRPVERDNELEHEMTVGFVAKNYPMIIWWSFFWCMCAVGCES
jgi:hypothetical protein